MHIRKMVPDAVNDDLNHLEFLLYSYMRNTRIINDKFRFELEEIETRLEKKIHSNLYLNLIHRQNNLKQVMNASREYQDMISVDRLLDTLKDEDKMMINDRYFYYESFDKIGKRYSYDKSSIQRRIHRILHKLLQEM